MSDLSIAGLEDEEDKVYVLGLSQDASESMKDWFFQEETVEKIQQQFQHARIVVLPLKIDGEAAVIEDSDGDFVRDVQITVSDDFTDEQ